MKNFSYLLIATLLIFSACRKDEIITEFEFEPIDNGELVSTILSGQLIDENGTPISDALVGINGEETSSNEDGYFTFPAMDISEYGTLLTVEKVGYFNSLKRVVPNPSNTYQRIGLIEQGAPTGIFSTIFFTILFAL